MIGILGGTFDPIHFGHLRPALELLQGLGLGQVRFIPLHRAVHRPQPQATPTQRLTMLRAALGDQAGFVADARELMRRGDSYTYDTLGSLRQEFGPREPLCLFLGTDAFQGFRSWHRPEGILARAHLVVMARPGPGESLPPDLGRWAEPYRCRDPGELRRRPSGRILFRTVTRLDISATQIRAGIARGQSPRFLVPEPVAAFIEREQLYRTA